MLAFSIKILRLETPAIAICSLTSLILALVLVVMPQFSPGRAAPPGTIGSSPLRDEADRSPTGQIGDSGYVVPIPEIHMKSIIGGKPPAAVQPPAPPEKESSGGKDPSSAEESGLPARGPSSFAPQEPASREESPVSSPEKKAGPAREPKHETSEPDHAIRLPFDPEYRTGPAKKQETEQPPQTVREKTIEGQLASPPVAPDEILEAPTPKKEVLKKKAAGPPPHLLEVAPVKGILKAIPVERMAIKGPVGAGEGIPLVERTEPEELPLEPEQAPAKLAGIIPPEPPVAEPVPEPETTRSEEPPVVEEPPASPARLSSPLEADALRSRDVKEYLSQTAPILEELSLLMTRAPSLAIADFDPSDPNPVIFPKDLYVKIDAMKRELQILDSKAFAIIPPAKYAPFHSLIRESIIHTYQACDAMIAYLNERSDDNLHKVHDHLIKARQLVQKTRVAQG